MYWEQGTRQYLEITAKEMASQPPGTPEYIMGKNILAALRNDKDGDKIQYMKVGTPLQQKGKPDSLRNFSIGTFKLSPTTEPTPID